MEQNVKRIVELFELYHLAKPTSVVSCGGRFEVLGNHTDHNHGLCIAAACNLQIIAAIKPIKEKVVRMKSEGIVIDEVDITDSHPYENEHATSAGLIRGVATYLKEHGYKVGGFEAYSESTVFKGAGVSSSAAFELLIAYIFNKLYNDEKIPTIVLCKAGQYAENIYFGKKSGLLDQIGVAYGGLVSIDFKNIEEPVIKKLEFPFKDLHFVIINTGGDHSSLSNLYSSIPEDMFKVANEMKQRFLAESTQEDLEYIKHTLSDLEYSRALHFYTENQRVQKALLALEDKDEELFLDMINKSRESSTNNLKNMMVGEEYKGSPLEACDLFMKATGGKGAVKINGGGFAGSIIGVVPTECLEKVLKSMSRKYGEENVKEIKIREVGPTTLYNF